MKKVSITELYKHYHIPKNLEMHMFWVAALGVLITNSWIEKNIDQDQVTTTLLLHDIGNLVKFDLDSSWWSKNMLNIALSDQSSPNFLADLKKIQQEMRKKYGKNSELANVAILRELGVNKEVIVLIEDHSWEHLVMLLETNDWEEKIVDYCDLRIIPSGLASVENRMIDLRNRYQEKDSQWANEEIFQDRVKTAKTLEKQLEKQTSIILSNVQQKDLEKIVAKLSRYEITIEV